MWSYALIAIGLINWDYQRAQANVVQNSLLIIIPGFILFFLTFTNFGKSILKKSVSKYFWGAIGLLAILFAFINK
jgi:hypothetical protein